MATRHKSGGDSKKLLTKTYSEIGVANNSQAETPTPSEKVEFLVKSSFLNLKCESKPNILFITCQLPILKNEFVYLYLHNKEVDKKLDFVKKKSQNS